MKAAFEPPLEAKIMELQERIDGDALVATVLESRLDASSAPALKRRMAALIKDGHHRLALDLSAVEFIDSAGPVRLAAQRPCSSGLTRIVL